MFKALKVLGVVAMVICLIEMFAVLVDLTQPVPPAAAGPFEAQGLARLVIYWLGGLGSLIVGTGLLKRVRLLGQSLSIGGVYLMLLGNNGGLFGSGTLPYRLCTSILTLLILSFI